MTMAFSRPIAPGPVCSQAGSRRAAFPVGRAERSEKAEGKIKETGTTLGRFLKLLLSAHCLGGPRAAPWFWTPRAAIWRKARALLDFDRHRGRRMPDFLVVWPEAQRDGTSRDGERGQLYSAAEDRADGNAFLERGKEDRHQFRFIVSPEDGEDLSDLTAHTRDLISRIETDLGTKLDWVAVNHYNTGHPHVHVIVRGKDDLGENLVINGDYLANGIRERASDLATLELGPVTEIEQSRKLSAEIDQDRFTRIDRAMTEEADDRFLDLRHEPAEPKRQFNRTLRLRRLAKLEKMGLATEHAPGVWELSERMEPTLRELGERGDIIRNMHKALKADGLERDPMTFYIHEGPPETPIVGRVVDKYLSDELGENLTVVLDGIDGRTHHVAGIDPARVEDARLGSVIEIGPVDTTQRPSDRTIAAIAKDGIYQPSRHLEQAKFEGRVPSSDYESYVDAHVRRRRRCAGPASSSGSTRTNGASPKISRAAPPPMTPDAIGRPAFACFRCSTLRTRSARTVRPGSTGDWYRPMHPTLCRPVSASRCGRRWSSAASITSSTAMLRVGKTVASSTGATFSPRCAIGRLPTSARR
ncbi:type IV secretory pathway VirD2 relaxase [Chelatococcus asaccharovorans]|uniref:Type IV secretory pathway VirD2 relaxase n=1 Tax=Chelatococcus asaccharovorans TaxID=28210 RepID=A0A2V3UHK9_9HYPH|nr:type IV secretory pathway VirD2 relaxase [Chelatococcus asaccharovorans]